MNITIRVITICCYLTLCLSCYAASPEIGRIFNKMQENVTPTQQNKKEPSSKLLPETKTKSRVPTILSKIFTPDTIGQTVTYFEKNYGPAKRIFGNSREYDFDGCNVTLDAGESISSIGLEITEQCFFDLNALWGNGDPFFVNHLTFGKFDKLTDNLGNYFADCLQGCGNAYDPSVRLIFEGPRSFDFMSIEISSPLIDDTILKASDIWKQAMLEGHGEDWVIEAKFNCDHKYDPVARKALANIPVKKIRFGNDINELCQQAQISTVPGDVIAASSKANCPQKVLETRTVVGIFDGTDCGDACYANLKLDNGDFFSVYADQDEVTKIFGEQTGIRVSMAYTVEQYWEFENIEETNPNGPGICTKGEFFKTGTIISPGNQGRPQTEKGILPEVFGGGGLSTLEGTWRFDNDAALKLAIKNLPPPANAYHQVAQQEQIKGLKFQYDGLANNLTFQFDTKKMKIIAKSTLGEHTETPFTVISESSGKIELRVNTTTWILTKTGTNTIDMVVDGGPSAPWRKVR